ncbi:MAG: amidohydrolase family protein [Planctomycetes bacterium]|nr:amidohydrolase family protein [Planctomycetota bacterium]
MSVGTENRKTGRSTLIEDLRHAINEVPVIDGHDCIVPRKLVLESGDVLFDLFAASCLPPGAVLHTPPVDPARSWETLEPYLPNLTNTSAYRCLVAAAKLLYDFEDFPLDERGYTDLRERMAGAYSREDWYVEALRNRANIDAVIWAMETDIALSEQEREIFLPAPNLDIFIRAHESTYREQLEQRHYVKLQEFLDVVELLAEVLTELDEKGVPSFWLSFSRFRPLMVRGVGTQEAAVAFMKSDGKVSPDEARLFQDYLIHQIADKCSAFNIPLQIDTGAHANPLSVEHSDPCQLAAFVAAHTRTRFVFLHGGYPFARHVGAQAKTFPNIYVDGSALAAHSLSAVREIVGEWIELVPVAKLLLWGGNATRIEAAIGSLLLMKDALAQILAERVESGFFSRELAFDLVRKLLRDIPRRFYRTDEIRIRRKTSEDVEE